MRHADTPEIWPRASYAWYTVGLLAIAYFLGFVDRSVLNLLIEPIKADLNLSDVEVSLIAGFSFAVFYAIGGIPLGWLADRGNRKWIVSCSIAAWSVMTALCGLTKGFTGLFVARVGVGIGEAGLNPSAMSIISDMFPPHRRSFALTTFYVGGVLGAGFATVIGAFLLTIGTGLAEIDLPVVHHLRPWQWVMILVALPGFPLAVLVAATLREPKRKGLMSLESGAESPTWRDTVAFYREYWKSFVSLMMPCAFAAMTFFGFLVWGTPLAMRIHGMTIQEAAILFMLPSFVFSVIGSFAAAGLGRYLARKGYKDAPLRAILIILLLTGIPIVAGLLVPSRIGFILLVAPAVGILSGTSILGQIAIQTYMPNQMRGQTLAVYSFIGNILGYGVSPTLIAILTDHLYRSEALINLSMLTTSVLFLSGAIIILFWGMKHFRAMAVDMEEKGVLPPMA